MYSVFTWYCSTAGEVFFFFSFILSHGGPSSLGMHIVSLEFEKTSMDATFVLVLDTFRDVTSFTLPV